MHFKALVQASMAFLIFSSSSALAGVAVGMSGLYLSDEFVTSSTASNSKTLINGNLLFSVDNKERLYVGFHGHQLTFEEKISTTTTSLTSLDMGPYIMAYLDKRRFYYVGFGYNLLVKGTYTSGTSNQELEGTSLMGTLGVSPEVGKNFYLGFDLNYVKTDYTKSTTGSAVSDVSYSRTFILPTVTLLWRN